MPMKNNSTVDPQEISKFAQLASHWWDKNGALKTLHDINPPRLEFITNHVEVAEKRILDVGCGGGILADALASLGGQVTGLDAEIEAIEAARAQAQRLNKTITYHCSAIEDYEDQPFDLITCMEMLEHVTKPELVIEHCARLLKPGGYLFLSTISRTPKAYLSVILAAEYLLNLLPRQTHDFQKFIKPSELITMTRNAGLEFLSLTGLGYNPLNRHAYLKDDVKVNYLLACFKP